MHWAPGTSSPPSTDYTHPRLTPYSRTGRRRRRTKAQRALADDTEADSAPQRLPRTLLAATPLTVAPTPVPLCTPPHHDGSTPRVRALRPARRLSACQSKQRRARSRTRLAHLYHAAAGLAPALVADPGSISSTLTSLLSMSHHLQNLALGNLIVMLIGQLPGAYACLLVISCIRCKPLQAGGFAVLASATCNGHRL